MTRAGGSGGDVDVPLHLEKEVVAPKMGGKGGGAEGRALAEGGAPGERLHYTFSLSPCGLGVEGERAESGVMVGKHRLLELRVANG